MATPRPYCPMQSQAPVRLVRCLGYECTWWDAEQETCVVVTVARMIAARAQKAPLVPPRVEDVQISTEKPRKGGRFVKKEEADADKADDV